MKPVTLPEISEDTLATILEIISDGIWDWNASTGQVYRSPGWFRMLNYDVSELENTVFTWESIIHPDDFNRVMKSFHSYIEHKSDTYKIQYRCRTKDNKYIWIEDRGRVVEWNNDGTVGRMIGAHRDIDAEKILQQQNQRDKENLQSLVETRTEELNKINHQLNIKITEVEQLATTDSLTLLFNRRGFEKKLSNESARAKRFKEPLSLIVFDLDNFKPVNDVYGHSSGDLVLFKVAEVLRQHLREIDIPARWGGDEFLILLTNTTKVHASKLAEKLRVLIAEQPDIKAFSVTASFGVAQLGDDEDPMRLTIRADKALYQSKYEGRNK
ncbi:MAG: sensor domain-containing diguanylate cyclase, partial [Pseudomonadota bacterium]|nr:sensor domain-containing diguanylate cyclase [Pseudomonadota bacterium]